MIKAVISVFLALVVVFMMAVPVLAIADPDTPPSVNAVYVYEDLLEDGDVGVLIDYYLDYAVTPSETATEAYLGVFVDTDGTTQLKSVAPYTFVDSGYGRGLIWIYFDATEVTTYSIDSANEALYDIWLCGNPTIASGWVGDPPKTTASIDQWYTTGDPAVLLALQVLYYADLLELIWAGGIDLIETTALGSRLTATGENYFENVIENLRLMAPSAFSAGTIDPTWEDLDYSTSFGATIEDGTGTLTVSPQTLAEGDNNLIITATGTFIVELERGTVGTAEDVVGGATVTGSPTDLVYGLNTITVTLGGINNFNINVELQNTQTTIEDTITGTALDLTTVATRFGMSRLMFSGIVWFIVTVIICAAMYRVSSSTSMVRSSSGVVMLAFDVCIVAGAVLGLLHPLVAILMFIGFGTLTGYMLFFRGASF